MCLALSSFLQLFPHQPASRGKPWLGEELGKKGCRLEVEQSECVVSLKRKICVDVSVMWH